METFYALLTLREEKPPVTGGFPLQRPVTWVFSLICVWTNGWANNRRWFETPSCSLWRHCNELQAHKDTIIKGIFDISLSPEELTRNITQLAREGEVWGVFHYGDVIMGAIASQITSLRLFTQPFIQTQIKENIKAPRHWPLCGEFTGDRWIPHTNGQ